MQRRIEGWGGDQAVLWASVRDTKPREGVAVEVHVVGGANGAFKDGKRPGAFGHLIQENHEVRRPTKTKQDRKIARLQAALEKIAPKRDELKKELDMILLRRRILQLATARADEVDECGWDHRLCYDEEDLVEVANSVLESYAAAHILHNGGGGEGLDGAVEDEWWCRGKKKCQRHAGYVELAVITY